MFPDLGPPSPVLPPRPLSIAEGIIPDRQVDVVMGEAEPDWSGEIARLDRQWGIRFRALDEQWNCRFVTLNRDWETRVTTFDRQWVELAGSMQRQLGTLRQTVESKVKANFGEALQAQLEVASAAHDESISNLRCDLMEYIDSVVDEAVLSQVENTSGCPCQIPGKCPCVRREPETRTPRRSKRSTQYVHSDESDLESTSWTSMYGSESTVRLGETGTHTSGPNLAIIRTQTPMSSTKGMGTIPLGHCVSVQLMPQGSTTGSIPAAGRRRDW